MLLFLDSPQIPGKTFTLTVDPTQTIARARAQFLHVLFNMGLGDVPPRFTFNGMFMKDKHTFEDYELNEAVGDGIRLKYFLESRPPPPDEDGSADESDDEGQGQAAVAEPEPGIGGAGTRKRRASALTSLEESLGVKLQHRGNGRRGSTAPGRRGSAATAKPRQRPLSTFYNPYLITEPKEATTALLRQQSVVKLLPDGETAPPDFECVEDVKRYELAAHTRRTQDLLVVTALKKETQWFIEREQLIRWSYVCVWINLVSLIPLFLSSWYPITASVGAVLAIFALWTSPYYSRVGGFMLPMSSFAKLYARCCGLVALGSALINASFLYVEAAALHAACSGDGDGDGDSGGCQDTDVMLVVGFAVIVTASTGLTLLYRRAAENFGHEAGDCIEEAMTGEVDPATLIRQALRGSPDVSRAATLRIAALLTSTAQEADEDAELDAAVADSEYLPFKEALSVARSHQLRGRKEWADWCRSGERPAEIPVHPDRVYMHTGWQGWAHWLAGFAETLCSLAVSDDDVVRAYTSEALLAFCEDQACRRAFIMEGGLASTMSLIHHGAVVDGVKLDHRQQTADGAIVALAWVLQETDVQAVFFEDSNMIAGLGSRVENGAFSGESLLVLAQLFDDLLGNNEQYRQKRMSHESIASCLVALLAGTDVEQLVLTLQTSMLMFGEETTDVVQRRYVRGVMRMRSSFDMDVTFLRAQFLLKVALTHGAAAEYVLTFGPDLISALRSFLATEFLDLVRLTVGIIKELVQSDNDIRRHRVDLLAVVEEASAMDDSGDFQALIGDVNEMLKVDTKGRFKKGVAKMGVVRNLSP